jgi:acetyl esterase
VLALMGRDGAVPRSAYQVLFYPATDLLAEGASYREPFIAGPLSAQAMRYFLGHYLPEAIDRSDWHVSPLRVASLAGAPPAFVLTCGHDPLETEGRAYVQRLEADGVPVTALHANDQAHGILNLGTAIGAAPAMIDFAASCLKEAWRQHRI